MKQYIIGIAGEVNSGKDTIASMLNYIFSNGISKSGFSDWAINRVRIDTKYENRITHFADPMKDCLSIMYNIPREYFDDRKYKDEMYYVIKEKRFIDEKEANRHEYHKISIGFIENSSNSLAVAISDIEWNGYKPIIKLRTLMQYFGTEIGRERMGKTIWIDSTMYRSADIAQTYGLCIIPDVRYINENSAITGNLLYGGTIYTHGRNGVEGDHDSEKIDFTCEYDVLNNGSLLQLFYKVLNIAQNIITTK